MKMRSATPLALALLALCRVAGATGQLSVGEAWIRTPPPGMRMLAGYAVLHNDSDQAVAVTAASSAEFASASLHESSESNGVERMRALDRIDVPAHGSTALKPGGMHLMLMQPQRELKAGDRAVVHLKTADGRDIVADFVVRDGAP